MQFGEGGQLQFGLDESLVDILQTFLEIGICWFSVVLELMRCYVVEVRGCCTVWGRDASCSLGRTNKQWDRSLCSTGSETNHFLGQT